MGLEKLIDWIIQRFEDLVPFVVIDHYERGVRLRFGKPKGVLNPGIHFKLPYFDNVLTEMVKVTTMETEQTLTTKDGKEVVVRAIIKYDVHDVETLLLEVNNPIDAVSDMTRGIIRDSITKLNWSECNGIETSNEIVVKARREAKKWGVNIIAVTLTDLAMMRTIRLLNNYRANA